MTKYEVFVNGKYLDLYPNTVIACTYQAVNLSDIKSRYVSYANEFGVPYTPDNDLTFGLVRNEHSESTIPYDSLNCIIYCNGNAILTGKCIVKDTKKDYNLEVYGDAYPFFDLLGDRSIQELVTLADDPWSSGSTLLKKPVIDYGEFIDALNPLQFNRSIYWSLNYSYIIEQIIKQNGYEKSGDIFSDGKYAALHLSALGYGERNSYWTQPKEFSAFRDTSVVMNATSAGTLMNFTDVEYNGGFYDGSNTWTFVDTVYGGALFFFEAYVDINIAAITYGGGASRLKIELFGGGSTATWPLIVGTGNYKLAIQEGFDPAAVQVHRGVGIDGSFIQVRITPTNNLGVPTGTAAITFGTSRLWNKVITDKATNDAMPSVSIQALLPDVKMSDMMKDFAVRFGLLFSETAGTLSVKRIEDVFNDRANAVNWTDKRVGKDEPDDDAMNFQFENFSQINDFKYQNDDDLREALYNGQLLIANKNLTPRSDYYTSIFQKSATNIRGNSAAGYITMARIPVSETVNTGPVNKHDPAIFHLNYDMTLSGQTVSARTGLYHDTPDGGSVLTENTVLVNVTLPLDARVLATNMIDKTKNGLWVVKAGAWVRPPDFDSAGDGDLAFVEVVATGVTLTTSSSTIQTIPGFFWLPQTGVTIGTTPLEFFACKGDVGTPQTKAETDPRLRLTLVRNKLASEPTLAGGNSTYKVAYFDDSTQPYGLSWQQALDENYKALTAALQKVKVVTRDFYLTDMDIFNLDLLRLVQDRDAYYFILSIDNFIPEQPTTVKLLKV